MRQKFLLLSLIASFPAYGEIPINRLSIHDAERIALECNKQLRIAKEGTEQADERESQALSRWFPKVRFLAEFLGTELKEDFFNIYSQTMPFTPSRKGYYSSFQLDQPLFSTDLIFGYKAKQFEAEAVLYSQASTQNELLLAVRESYYAVVSLEISLKIQREVIDYYSYALQQSQGKLDAGSMTPFEVNQSKVAVANTISQYYATLRGLKNARNALILTLGVDPLLEREMCLSESAIPLMNIPEISLKLAEIQEKYHYRTDAFSSTADFLTHIDRIEQARRLTVFTEEDVEEQIELAISLRPDLKTMKMKVGAAEENLRSKQGHYLPEINGYFRYGYNDHYLGPTPFGSQNYNWVGGLSLSWNLFDSLLREHEIREARSMRRASNIGYDKEYQRIEVEVTNGLYQFEEAMLTYLSSTQGVMIAEQAHGQAKDKLLFGRIAPLEYRDSVNQLYIARNQQNRASFDLIDAYYKLRFSLGLDSKNQ